jgi:hypothetical protein
MKGQKIKVEFHITGKNLAGRDKEGLHSDPYYVIYVPEKIKSEDIGHLPETISYQKSHCLFPFVLPASAALYGINHSTVTAATHKGFKIGYRSEKVKKNLNPEWKVTKQNLKDLCCGDLTAPIVIQCWHSEMIHHDVLIGGSIITMGDLFSSEVAELQLMDSDHKPAGILQIKAIPSNLVAKEIGEDSEAVKPHEQKTPELKVPEQNGERISPRKSPRVRGSFLANTSPKTVTNSVIRLGRDRRSTANIPQLEEHAIQFLPGSAPVESTISLLHSEPQFLPGCISESAEITTGSTETIPVTQTEPEYTYLPPADLL